MNYLHTCIFIYIQLSTYCDSLFFVGYQFWKISWEHVHHIFICSTNCKCSLGFYTDFKKTMNSNIYENKGFSQSTKIDNHEHKLIHITAVMIIERK